LKYTRLNEAFTLIEILLAISISAIVLLTSYQVFNAVERTSSFTLERSRTQNLISNLFILFLRDFESSALSYGEFEIEDNNGTFSFYTKNCFFVPGVCNVKYYMYKRDGWNFLVREERKLNSTVNAGFEIPITENVEGFKVQLPSGLEWTDAKRGTYKPNLVRVLIDIRTENGTITVPFNFKLRA